MKVLDELRKDIKHVRRDVDVLKGMLFEDAVLTKEERAHLDETIHLFKEGKTREFVRLV